MSRIHLANLLPTGPYIVLCGRPDDARAWRDLLGADPCCALPLDTAPRQPGTILRGATDHLAWHHRLIADLDQPGWLTDQADAFDPHRQATLLLPDPLDPPMAGTRPSFGRRHPAWSVLENKTAIDRVWDAIDLPRTQSIVADAPADLAQLGPLVDQGSGVVCAVEPAGKPASSGGDRVHWWRDQPPPQTRLASKGTRVRLMPLLPGLPARIHGLVTTDQVVVFPPLEVVTLLRPGHGTFLCAGTAPTLADNTELHTVTEHAGEALRRTLRYRGAFSIDGILTADGFRPTDLNPRLTSAMEPAPPALRVCLHLANMLAREAVQLDPHHLRSLVADIFARQETYTLYGATKTANSKPRQVPVRWQGDHLVVAHNGQAHGRLAIAPSPRGWLLTATLHAQHIPREGPLSSVAQRIFELSDTVLGTDFDELVVPEGALTRGAPSRHAMQQAAHHGEPA